MNMPIQEPKSQVHHTIPKPRFDMEKDPTPEEMEHWLSKLIDFSKKDEE